MNTVAQPTIHFTCPHCQAQFDALLSLAMQADVLVPETVEAQIKVETGGGSID